MSNHRLKNNISDTTMRVVVYCSAAESLPDHWREGAAAIGRWIGERGATLVYGGANPRPMTETAADAPAPRATHRRLRSRQAQQHGLAAQRHTDICRRP